MPGTRPGQFQHPADLAVDPKTQFVYVTDVENSRIQKFDKNSSYVSEWGSLGTGDGEFNHPGDIDIGSSEGIIFVTDMETIGFKNSISLVISCCNGALKELAIVSLIFQKFHIDPTDGVVYVLDTMNNEFKSMITTENL